VAIKITATPFHKADMEHLIDQETAMILREGMEARDLLANKTFVALLNQLSDQYLAEIVGSQAHETKTREDRYLRIQVLKELAHTLNTRVALAERAEAEIADYDPDTEET
jgi:hypothetical protein